MELPEWLDPRDPKGQRVPLVLLVQQVLPALPVRRVTQESREKPNSPPSRNRGEKDRDKGRSPDATKGTEFWPGALPRVSIRTRRHTQRWTAPVPPALGPFS